MSSRQVQKFLAKAEKLAKSIDAHLWTHSSGVRADFPAPVDVMGIHILSDNGEPYVHVVVEVNHDLSFVTVTLLEAHAPQGARSFITAFDVDLDGTLVIEKSEHMYLWTPTLAELVKATVKTLVQLNAIYVKLDKLVPRGVVKFGQTDLELTRMEYTLNLTLAGWHEHFTPAGTGTRREKTGGTMVPPDGS